MNVPAHRNGVALALFIGGFILLVMLALASTTWAAPNAQGTVPTPPKPTARPTVPGPTPQPTSSKNGGGQDSGGENVPTAQPTAPTAPTAPGVGTVCAIGETGAQCSAENLAVIVSAGAAPAGAGLTIEGPFAQPPCPASPESSTFLNRCYRFMWTGADAQPLAALNGPVQYCLQYGAEQLAATENKPEAMLVGFADANGTWVVVKPTVDAASSHICATTNQLIVWSALFAANAPLPLLPTTGNSNAVLWMILFVILGGALMVAAWRVARKGA